MYDEEPRYITGPNRKRSTRDPFVARIGLIVIGFVMLLPVAIFLRPDTGATVKTSGLPGAVAVLQPAVADAAVASVDTAPISSDGMTGSGIATDLSQTSPSDAASPAETLAAAPTLPAAETLPPAETLPAAQTLPPAATQADSTALSGGSATTTKRKSANATTAQAPATTKPARTTTTTAAPTTTVAPARVTVPAQATKVPPATSAAKAPVTTATKTVQTTTAPKQTTTTAPPATTTTTTTVAPKNYSAAEVQAIIVSIWPADQQTQALAIAWRESNDKPMAQNFCCYGLFQIHYQANQAWLNSVGISNPAQLFDPKTNAYIALLMYQRSGWTPWNA